MVADGLATRPGEADLLAVQLLAVLGLDRRHSIRQHAAANAFHLSIFQVFKLFFTARHVNLSAGDGLDHNPNVSSVLRDNKCSKKSYIEASPSVKRRRLYSEYQHKQGPNTKKKQNFLN